MKLSLCIVGCGGYARSVLDEIHDLTDDFALYFASRDLNKAREYSETFHGEGYFGSYEEAAADPRVEALYFFTPHDLHLENAKLAARHSKHVLMEKPIARTLDEGRQLIDAAREAGVTLMIAENYRFVHTIAKCKEIIEQGGIGKLRSIQIQREQKDFYGPPTGWRARLDQAGGGVLIDAGIHDVDALVNLGGFPERLYAATPPQILDDVEGEDGITLMARLPGGATGLIHFSWASPMAGYTNFMTITGATGRIEVVPFGSEIVIENPPVRRTVRLPEARMGVRPMVLEFRDAIREDREPAMSGYEGLKDLAVVHAAYESVKRGQAVSPALP